MFNKTIAYSACIAALYAILAATPTMAADASNTAARVATWEKEFNAGNPKGVAMLYAANGCRMPPHATVAQGTEGILANVKSARDQGAATVKLGVTAAESTGNWSYATGTFVLTAADGKHLDHGKWMNVSKKSKGQWLIQCDIWNSDMAIPSEKAK
jgi:ketosteroid isomerase-like protein